MAKARMALAISRSVIESGERLVLIGGGRMPSG
jgi:hypothetical protein